jgi:hypothetical protein
VYFREKRGERAPHPQQAGPKISLSLNVQYKRKWGSLVYILYTVLSSLWVGAPHGLINYTDTNAFVGFSLKLTCRKNFLALISIICHHSRRKCIYLWKEGGGEGNGAQDLPKTQKNCRKITINYLYALSSLYIISQWGTGKGYICRGTSGVHNLLLTSPLKDKISFVALTRSAYTAKKYQGSVKFC